CGCLDLLAIDVQEKERQFPNAAYHVELTRLLAHLLECPLIRSLLPAFRLALEPERPTALVILAVRNPPRLPRSARLRESNSCPMQERHHPIAFCLDLLLERIQAAPLPQLALRIAACSGQSDLLYLVMSQPASRAACLACIRVGIVNVSLIKHFFSSHTRRNS